MLKKVVDPLDETTRHQVNLERYKAGQVKKVQKAIERLELALAEQFDELEVEKLSDLSHREIVALRERLSKELGKVTDEWSRSFLTELNDLAVEEAKFQVALISAATIKTIVAVLPNEGQLLKRLAKSPMTATGSSASVFVRDWTKDAIKQLDERIFQGYREHKTVDEIVRSIVGTKKANYRDGLTGLTRRQAEAVVRTTIQHTNQTAYLETWEANSDIAVGYRWVSTLDGRTSEVCRSLDGRIFPHGKGPTPPAHVNCRSSTIAEIDEAFAIVGLKQKRSSKDGPVDAGLTYYDWLKKQSASFQDEVLGPTRAKLLRDGGMSTERFAKLSLNRHFEPLTLDEMRRKNAKAFEMAGL